MLCLLSVISIIVIVLINSQQIGICFNSITGMEDNFSICQ